MADMVYNEVYFSGKDEKVKQIMEAIKSEDSVVDFNKIIPIPEELKKSTVYGGIVLSLLQQRDKNEKDNFKFYLENPHYKERNMTSIEELIDYYKEFEPDLYQCDLEAYGHYNKYGFTNVAHWCDYFWGTSRNAEDADEICDEAVSFYTAWSPVEELFIELSNNHPDITIQYNYSYETMESSTIKDGGYI